MSSISEETSQEVENVSLDPSVYPSEKYHTPNQREVLYTSISLNGTEKGTK